MTTKVNMKFFHLNYKNIFKLEIVEIMFGFRIIFGFSVYNLLAYV